MGAESARVIGDGLFIEAHSIIEKSVHVTPKDAGILRGSATVGSPQISAKRAKVEFGYGGAASDYATAVHEMTGSVNWSEPGTGAKYLEEPVTEHGQEFARNMAGHLDTWFRGFSG